MKLRTLHVRPAVFCRTRSSLCRQRLDSKYRQIWYTYSIRGVSFRGGGIVSPDPTTFEACWVHPINVGARRNACAKCSRLALSLAVAVLVNLTGNRCFRPRFSSLKNTKIRSRPGLAPHPALREPTALFQTPNWIWGRGKQVRKMEGRKRGIAPYTQRWGSPERFSTH